jgi:hypothetical protein
MYNNSIAAKRYNLRIPAVSGNWKSKWLKNNTFVSWTQKPQWLIQLQILQ